MTYLELLRTFAIDYGISGAHRNITSMASLPGQMTQAKRQIDRAYNEIQLLWQDWTFLSANVDYAVESEASKIGPGSTGWRDDVKGYKENEFYVRNVVDKKPISLEPWISFNRRRNTQSYSPNNTLPDRFSVDPSGQIHFYPPSLQPFVLNVEVYLKPHVMVAETDVPIFGDEHHDCILYKAAMHHLDYENAPEEHNRASVNYAEALTALEGAYLPLASRSVLSSDDAPMQMYSE